MSVFILYPDSFQWFPEHNKCQIRFVTGPANFQATISVLDMFTRKPWHISTCVSSTIILNQFLDVEKMPKAT